MIDIIIGALGSILASVVIAIFLYAYDIRIKEKLLSRINLMHDYAQMISNHCSYVEDYYNVIHYTEEIMRLIREINDLIKPLNGITYGKMRKLFFTILYDLQYRCERICFQTIGYDGSEEINARIARIKKEHFTAEDNEFVFLVEIEWLNAIIDRRKPHITENIVQINSFCIETQDKGMRRKGISEKTFNQMLKETK